MVKEQFLKTPNADSYRLNDEDVRNIKLSLLILDTTIPLPEPKGRGMVVSRMRTRSRPACWSF